MGDSHRDSTGSRERAATDPDLDNTPTSVSSRSSRASVSSGRRRSQRKDQSLQSLSESLGRSNVVDTHTLASSSIHRRELDFESAMPDENNVDDDAGPSATLTEDEEQLSEDDAEEFFNVLLFGGKKRRKTVWWTAVEEDFLREGVQKYGVGKWKRILLDGRDVFLSHRTNVDLKDKWANLIKRDQGTSRNVATADPDSATTRRSSPRLAKKPRTVYRARSSSEGSSGGSSESDDSSQPKAISLSPRLADRAVRHGEQMDLAGAVADSPGWDDDSGYDYELNLADEDSAVRPTRSRGNNEDHLSAPDHAKIKLQVGTDASFPGLTSLAIDLRSCGNVAALKTQIRSKLLPNIPSNRSFQLVGLASRRLVEDTEALARCVRQNGHAFYIVVDAE